MAGTLPQQVAAITTPTVEGSPIVPSQTNSGRNPHSDPPKSAMTTMPPPDMRLIKVTMGAAINGWRVMNFMS